MPEYCLIKHRIENVTIDGADSDRNPDRMPITGMVTFTPLLGKGDAVLITESGQKTTLTLSPIEARITNGELWHRGEPGVKLFAGGPDSNPERIRYRAQFSNLIGGGKKVELKDTVFEAAPGGEMELSTVQPAPAQPYPGYTPSMEAAISEISAVRDSSIDYATTKIGEYRDEALDEADLAIQAAKDANTVPRVVALEAMNGVSPESPVDGQTANLISQDSTLTRLAVNESIIDHTTMYPVEKFGAVGDGATDDTAAWNAAVAHVYAQGGGTIAGRIGATYMIQADGGTSIYNDFGGISLKSGVHMYLPEGCTLKALTISTKVSKVVRVNNQENIRIYGSGTVDGSRDGVIPEVGEWGHGIVVNAGRNITIEGVRVIDCWGDGININFHTHEDRTPPEDITIRGVTCRNNRRQGITIGAGRRVLVENSTLADTNGVLPATGINVEVSLGDTITEDVTIRRNYFVDNARRGLMIYENTRGNTNGLIIEGNTFVGNGIAENTSQVMLSMSGDQLIFRGNIIRDGSPDSFGLDVRGPKAGGVISGNVIHGDVSIGGTGWVTGYPEGLTFSDNIVRGGQITVAWQRGFTISGNTLFPPSGKAAVKFSGEPAFIGKISGNAFYGGLHGIDLHGEGSPPQQIEISDNIFKDTQAAALNLIGIYITVRGNTFWGCCLTSGVAIIEAPTHFQEATQLQITENTFRVDPQTEGLNTNVPLYAFRSGNILRAVKMQGNRFFPTWTKPYPDSQETGAGTILAGAGTVPARTSQYRPTGVPAGTQFYDMTQYKLLVYSGSVWRHMDGTPA